MTETDPTAEDPRTQLLDALDFSYCQGLGYSTPEELLAAYDTSRTPAAVSPVDRAALRQRIAEALYGHNHPGWARRYADLDQDEQDTYLARASAVLAVLPPPVSRADVYRELAHQQEQTAATDVIRRRRSIATARRLFAVELRRMADEAQPAATPAAVLADVEQAVYEYRELTCQWDETDGSTQAIAERATRAALRALGLTGEAPTACPGYETVPNRCTCGCEGCKHHCGAHQGDEAQPGGGPQQPSRGDAVERWLKAQRDEHRDTGRGVWTTLDNLLDRYRLHADMGVPLGGHVCEARVVGDCRCLEQPASEAACTCGTTACESELCDCDSAPCPVDHAAAAQQDGARS
ncbi:hypothetical protein KEF29_03420 [Streptomyces tuirus]|uniref:Uncharacterized protein n=1 Tax=Streptomyces tuirus TaxID=68278 RepID=A0A941J0I7_9ACTN|nr:hypothetical protein [Streptomyces tuirus]